MTISTTATYARASGNGVTTVFNFTFDVFASTDLVVSDIVDATGVATTKTLTTDYSVAISATTEGGTVTFVTAPAAGHTVDIRSVIPLQQPTSIRNQGPFNPEIHEAVFDRLERQIQDTRRIVESAIRFPDYEIARSMELPKAASIAGLFLGFNASSQPTALSGTGNDSALRTDLADATGAANTLVAIKRTPAELAAGSTIVNAFRDPGDWRRYGASTASSGATNDTAFNRAVAQAKQAGGSPVILTEGSYATAGGMLIDSYTSTERLRVIGYRATVVPPANTVGLSITNSDNVGVTGVTFAPAAASGLNQRGIYTNNCGRLSIIDNDFINCTYGIYVDPTRTGLATGAFPIPSMIAMNRIRACAAGIYCAPSAEYVAIENNTVNDCTLFGVAIDAGNVNVLGNTITGNLVGVQIDGSGTANGDHGAVVGNTINHNSSANLVIKNMDYSMSVVGNNLWAAIASDYAAAPLNSRYGVLLSSAFNVAFTGNTLGNNIQNLALNNCANCSFTANNFIADNGRTTFNIKDVDGNSIKANRWSSNTFGGSLLAGANNNDPEQTHSIAAAGEPAFQNAWVNFGGSFRAAAFYKDASNIVHLTGVVKTGAVGSVMFTLPTGFRPNASLIFPTCSNSLFGYNQVDGNGDVTCKVGSNVFVALDGISFRAES